MRSEVFKKAWAQKYYTGKTFAECLKWAWAHTSRVVGKATEAVESTAFEMEEDFISGMAF